MRIQSIHTYKVLQQIKHFNAYTIILIYNINPDVGVNSTGGEYGSFFVKRGRIGHKRIVVGVNRR